VKTSLVTGGAGFIGSHVCQELIDKGHKVVALDDLSGGFKDNVPAGSKFVEGSILDIALLNRLFEENSFDYVFHLAAYAAEGLSHFIKRFNYENNLLGSVNLINLSIQHNIKCFVFTSSIAVYGKGQAPLDEKTNPKPEDPYGIAKLAVEQELKISQEMFDLPFIIFRPHNVYGERQNIGDKYRNVVGIFMNQIMQNLPMTIFGDGKQKRAFSHISDVAPIIATSIDIPKAFGEVFNIGSDMPHTLNELSREVASVFGVESPQIKYLEARNEALEAYADHSKLRKFMDIGPALPLREGLVKFAKWAKKHGPRKSKEFDNIEIKKNLPSSWL
jgi:UDP-glucose 4-epimerase